MPATVIADRSDRDLVALFQGWVDNGWTPETLSRIPDLLPDAPVDPIGATDLHQLLVSALAQTDADERIVVLHPERPEDSATLPQDRWYRTLREAFSGGRPPDESDR